MYTKNDVLKFKKAYFNRAVLKEGLDKTYRHLTLSYSLAYKDYLDNGVNGDKVLQCQRQLSDFHDLIGDFKYNACIRVSKSRYNKIEKCKDKSNLVVKSGRAIFLTLTFTDLVLEKTSEETRRRYVARYLKSTCDFYIANQDFGKKKGREHYHALVYGKNGNVSLKKWLYGAINAERVKDTEDDITRTAKYVCKLSFHSVKDTASTKRLIYSRNNENFKDFIFKQCQRKSLRDFMAELKEASKTDEELIKEIF